MHSPERQILAKLREIFPQVRIIDKNPYILCIHNGVGELWNIENLAPEQQLDTMIQRIERYFSVQKS